MPTRLAAIYGQVQNDPEHVSIERNIAIREVFLRDGLEKLNDAGDPAQAWRDMRKLVDELLVALARLDEAGMLTSARRMGEIIDERYRYHEQVKELNNTLSEQRKDIQAIAKIELAKETAVSPTELMTLIAGFMAVINAHITDRTIRHAIADGIDKLFNSHDGSHTQHLERLTGGNTT